MKKKHVANPDAVLAFIEQYDGNEREIMEKLFAFMMRFPGMETRLSYGLPFFYKRIWICYLHPLKTGGVELCFTRAKELADEYQLLDFRGRSLIAGIVFKTVHEIPLKPLGELVREALMIDDFKTE